MAKSGNHQLILKRLQRGLHNVRFLTGDQIPQAALAEFYDQLFPQRTDFLKQYWRWLYRVENAEGIAAPMVALADERIIGHGGLIPVTLRRGAETRTAVWMVDFAVPPEHQRGLVGGGLVLMGMAACPLRVAFLNNRSWHMVEKLGWQANSHTIAFQLLLRPEQHARVRALVGDRKPLEWLARWSGVATRLIWRARAALPQAFAVAPPTADNLARFAHPAPDGALHAPRSAEFLRWRVLAHPHCEEYAVITATPATGKNYAAIVRVLDQGGYRRLHLLALQAVPHDDRALARFFAGIMHWAGQQAVAQLVFLTNDPQVARVAKRWFPCRSVQRYAYHADDAAGNAFLGGTDHRWELLDGDFEMMFEAG